MALRGVWQLQKLVVSYCNWGGSSRGIRAFMESELPALIEKNPQLEVATELSRGQHPYLKGIYSIEFLSSSYLLSCTGTVTSLDVSYFFLAYDCVGNRNERVVCVKNMDPEQVLLNATRLRNSLGRKVVKLRTRHVTKHPSVQGTWTTAVKF
ncbi:54S ribosomal protein L51, mitochondrial isoform X1 [Brassica rapa]|uniref:Large ribosomal subunit protein mL43 n=1 Tax=Brassica campestris TaxID=3711 RepID=M4CGQ0_BRACM|nr:54S ribosomal protein L51, mitochondrial isoform X1 [Brassica rapa]